MAVDDLDYMRELAWTHYSELCGEADKGGDVSGLRVRLAAMADAYIRDVSAPNAEALRAAYDDAMRRRDTHGRPEDRAPKPAPAPRPSPPVRPLLPPIVWVVAAAIALLAFVQVVVFAPDPAEAEAARVDFDALMQCQRLIAMATPMPISDIGQWKRAPLRGAVGYQYIWNTPRARCEVHGSRVVELVVNGRQVR